MLLVDSREKWTQKKPHDYNSIGGHLDRKGVPYRVEKLNVGDYMLEGGTITIDTKQDLEELSRNLMNRADHARFLKEVRRANEAGLRLVVLCRHGGKVKTIRDVAGWKSKYSPVTGRALMDEMFRVHISYGVDFLFCTKQGTAKKILEILKKDVATCGNVCYNQDVIRKTQDRS